MFEGFEENRVNLGDASTFVRLGGEGPPVVLLHGHPRTSATWHQVAPQLARHWNAVNTNAALFARVDALMRQVDTSPLDAEQKRP